MEQLFKANQPNNIMPIPILIKLKVLHLYRCDMLITVNIFSFCPDR